MIFPGYVGVKMMAFLGFHSIRLEGKLEDRKKVGQREDASLSGHPAPAPQLQLCVLAWIVGVFCALR